jgi:hypothetical protein
MVNWKSKYLEMKLKYINAKNKQQGGMFGPVQLTEPAQLTAQLVAPPLALLSSAVPPPPPSFPPPPLPAAPVPQEVRLKKPRHRGFSWRPKRFHDDTSPVTANKQAKPAPVPQEVRLKKPRHQGFSWRPKRFHDDTSPVTANKQAKPALFSIGRRFARDVRDGVSYGAAEYRKGKRKGKGKGKKQSQNVHEPPTTPLEYDQCPDNYGPWDT